MFYRPQLTLLFYKDAVIRLRGPECQRDPVSLNVLDGTPEDHGLSRIRFFVFLVRVENDDIASTEIGHIASVGLRELQDYGVYPPCGVSIGVDKCEPVVDVASSQFVRKRIVPGGGKAGALLGLVAQLGHDMLVGNECQESEIIGLFQFRGILNRIQNAGYLRLLVVRPKRIVDLLHIELVRRQTVENPVAIGLRIEHLRPGNTVSDLDGLEYQLR